MTHLIWSIYTASKLHTVFISITALKFTYQHQPSFHEVCNLFDKNLVKHDVRSATEVYYLVASKPFLKYNLADSLTHPVLPPFL